MMHQHGFATAAEERAYRLGAADEARLRDAPLRRLPRGVRDVYDYLKAVAVYEPDSVSTPGDVAGQVVVIFASTFTPVQKRAMRAALSPWRRKPSPWRWRR